MSSMKSYDIDGVLTVGVRPERPCIIVSGRLAQFMHETRVQFATLGIDPDIPVYLRPGGEPADRVVSGVWKATIINWARVDEHWEDDPVQAQIIAAMCRVRLVMVEANAPAAGFFRR